MVGLPLARSIRSAALPSLMLPLPLDSRCTSCGSALVLGSMSLALLRLTSTRSVPSAAATV